jgi:hypothetical protein
MSASYPLRHFQARLGSSRACVTFTHEGEKRFKLIGVHLKDVHVMGEPVEQRAGQPLGAKDARPILEWQVRRHEG